MNAQPFFTPSASLPICPSQRSKRWRRSRQRSERQAGAIIQIEGDAAEAMYVVARGRVKIARIGLNGREQVLNVIGPGGHFNTVPCSMVVRAQPTPKR